MKLFMTQAYARLIVDLNLIAATLLITRMVLFIMIVPVSGISTESRLLKRLFFGRRNAALWSNYATC